MSDGPSGRGAIGEAFDRGTITLAEAQSLVDEPRDGVPVILHERDSIGMALLLACPVEQ